MMKIEQKLRELESQQAPTFHARLRPFQRALPELGALGHSHVNCALPPRDRNLSSDAMIVIFVLRGGQQFHIADQPYTVRGGDMLIIPPHIALNTGQKPITRIEGFDLHLRLNSKRPFLGHRQYEPLRDTLQRLSPCQHIAPPHSITLLREMFRIIEQPAQVQDAIPRLTLNLGILLYQLIDATETTLNRPQIDHVSEAEKYMLDHLQEDLSVQDFSDYTGVSRTTLTLAFRKQRGISPMERFHLMKIEAACQFLQESSMTITQISTWLGFSSSQYFATVFKRYMSITPVAFRARFQTPTSG